MREKYIEEWCDNKTDREIKDRLIDTVMAYFRDAPDKAEKFWYDDLLNNSTNK